MNEIERYLNTIFGNQNDVIRLIKNLRWEDASKYGDHVSYNAVKNNKNWWWEQVETLDKVDKERWNSCSYGNIAMAVYYGQEFPERQECIDKIKMICERDL